MMYVYEREFEGRGQLRKDIVPFSNIGIFIFQIINYGFLGNQFEPNIFYVGALLILI